MTIRIAAETDIPEMHRIRISVRENRLLDPARVQPDHYRPMLTTRGRGWVAELEGRVGGFAIADREDASIWALFVDPSLEGRGLGRALHDTGVSWLFESGAPRIWLSTDPGTRAERLYRAAGWRPVGIRQGEAEFQLSREEWLALRAAAPGG